MCRRVVSTIFMAIEEVDVGKPRRWCRLRWWGLPAASTTARCRGSSGESRGSTLLPIGKSWGRSWKKIHIYLGLYSLGRMSCNSW